MFKPPQATSRLPGEDAAERRDRFGEWAAVLFPKQKSRGKNEAATGPRGSPAPAISQRHHNIRPHRNVDVATGFQREANVALTHVGGLPTIFPAVASRRDVHYPRNEGSDCGFCSIIPTTRFSASMRASFSVAWSLAETATISVPR
jgi:hypothetical protein